YRGGWMPWSSCAPRYARLCPRARLLRRGMHEGPATAVTGPRYGGLVRVTLVVVVSLAPRGEARSSVGAIVVAVGHGSELADIHRLALAVDDLGLAEHDGERLRTGDLADHAGNLAVLVEHLDELAGLHAVLRGGLDEVLGELVLADLDLFLL